jgi:predicted transcriptional regulator
LLLRIIVPAASIGGAAPLSADLRTKIEVRVVDKVNAGLALNEKTAGVSLPDLTGTIDFNSGFGGGDPSFHKWCADLFMFHWSKAKKI